MNAERPGGHPGVAGLPETTDATDHLIARSAAADKSDLAAEIYRLARRLFALGVLVGAISAGLAVWLALSGAPS